MEIYMGAPKLRQKELHRGHGFMTQAASQTVMLCLWVNLFMILHKFCTAGMPLLGNDTFV
jgi:hypothetical protein